MLEEQPKWALLAEILEEIERDSYLSAAPRDDSNGTILVMCSDQATCRQLNEYLQNMHVQPEKAQEDEDGDESGDEKPLEPSATFMMRRKLRNYLTWKRDFAKVSASLFAENQKALQGASNAQRGGDSSYRGKGPPNKRRRIRGGMTATATPSRSTNGSISVADDKASHVAGLLAEIQPTDIEAQQKSEIGADPLDDTEDVFELFEMQDLVVIHPYDGDMDEHVLEEVKPRYVIMYEPDAAFIRRVEVYRSSHNDRHVKVYFMYYGGSVEEQRYLSAVRREKDAYTRLIRERGNMAVTLTLDGKGPDDPQETFLRTINTRIAGGGRLTATATPPMVVVDVREFRSSLPSLLHGQSMLIVPCLLTVGDYILTPEICIERKSIRDLISSLNSGRLYSQAETMLQHYKSPMLLIEFDHNKSFTLEPFADLQNPERFGTRSADNPTDLQSKLVLLTLAFPRLKVIWSSSPYQTALIFQELKKSMEEPDPIKAVQVGLQRGDGGGGDPGGGGGEGRIYSNVPREMLRCIPGVTEKVADRLVMEVGSLYELACDWGEEELAELAGKEVARQVTRFLSRDLFE